MERKKTGRHSRGLEGTFDFLECVCVILAMFETSGGTGYEHIFSSVQTFNID